MNPVIVQLCSFKNIYNEKLRIELNNNPILKKFYDLYDIEFDSNREKFAKLKYKKKYSELSRLNKLLFWISFNTYWRKKYAFDNTQDIVNIQYVDFRFIFILPWIVRNFRKIILTFWGSDLLRQRKIRFILMYPLFYYSHIITFETEDMECLFTHLTKGRFKSKYRRVRFGLSELREIDACDNNDIIKFCNKFHIDTDKKIIVVGYNRSKEQNHKEVIYSLLESCSMNDLLIIIPWTYGIDDLQYRNEIEEIMNHHCNYIFIDKRLTDREVAALRKITTVLIQVQTTDSLSASMLETLYAGNSVLTGDWLPYNEIEKLGLTFFKVKNINECGRELNNLINNPLMEKEITRNKCLVDNYSSWESNLKRWMNIYRS